MKNVPITAGVGTSIAADEITDLSLGIVKVQYIKQMDARDGGSNRQAIDADGAMFTASVSSLLYAGIAAVTTTATAIGAQTMREIVLQADSTNAGDVLVGNSISQPYHLVPGASITLPINNASLVFLRVASGTANVNWLGRN